MEVPNRLQGTGDRKNRKNWYQVSGNSKQLTGKAGSRDQEGLGTGKTGYGELTPSFYPC
jgi:hypothetical protein